MVDLQEISFRYPDGENALNGINLKVNDSECLGIIGANGSGKTTLSKMIAGLISPAQGTRGVSSDLEHSIVYVYQNPDYQIFGRTVEEEIYYGLPIAAHGSKDKNNSPTNEEIYFYLQKYD